MLNALGVFGAPTAPEPGAAATQYEYSFGNIIVVKHVANNDGGTAAASDFTMTINGVPASGGNSFPGSEGGTDKQVTLLASGSSYSVSETGPAGYGATFSPGCSGIIAAGQTITCTVTNSDFGPARTIGYWKTHLDAIALGLKLGGYTVATTDDVQAVLAAGGSCSGSGMVNCLAAQLLATKVNLANGNSTCINPKVAQADALLVAVGYTGPAGSYTLTSAQRSNAEALKNALDKYNSGKGC